VRAELTNEMWAGTGRGIRLTMQGLTERELAGHLDPAQPTFLTSLTTTGIADLHLPEPVPDLDAYVRMGMRSGSPTGSVRSRAPVCG
jgi:hypothetical protein